MRDLDEPLARLAADTLRGRVLSDQVRMIRFELLQLPQHGIVFAIGDLRRVEHVIKMLVMAQTVPQRFDFYGYGFLRHCGEIY